MAKDGRPNILFFFPDQHRGDWMPGRAGLPLRMPNLERLMAEGVTFTQALTDSPVCAPARAALAAGKAYDRCGVVDNGQDYPLDQPTFYQHLRDAGYRVAGVGKFDLHKPNNPHTWGLDGKHLLPEWGFTDGIDNEGKIDGVTSGRDAPQGPYLQFLEERGLREVHVRDMLEDRKQGPGVQPTPLPDDAYCDNWLSQNGLDILDGLPADAPWFLQINFTGPHSPWDVTASMLGGWEEAAFPPPVANDSLDPGDANAIRRNYAAMLENIDRQVGRFLDKVRERGEEANTLVVYSSDHGEMLGDHERWGKGIFRHPSVGIPLVVVGPGVRRGATTDAVVALRDLAATFLEAAGADPLPEADARSIGPVCSGLRRDHREVFVGGLKDWRIAYDGRYKLVCPGGAPDALYDLEADPDELENRLAAAPEVAARLEAACRSAGAAG